MVVQAKTAPFTFNHILNNITKHEAILRSHWRIYGIC